MEIVKCLNLLPYPFKILIACREAEVVVYSALTDTTLKMGYVSSSIHFAGHTINKVETVQAATLGTLYLRILALFSNKN